MKILAVNRYNNLNPQKSTPSFKALKVDLSPQSPCGKIFNDLLRLQNITLTPDIKPEIKNILLHFKGFDKKLQQKVGIVKTTKDSPFEKVFNKRFFGGKAEVIADSEAEKLIDAHEKLTETRYPIVMAVIDDTDTENIAPQIYLMSAPFQGKTVIDYFNTQGCFIGKERIKFLSSN